MNKFSLLLHWGSDFGSDSISRDEGDQLASWNGLLYKFEDTTGAIKMSFSHVARNKCYLNSCTARCQFDSSVPEVWSYVTTWWQWKLTGKNTLKSQIHKIVGLWSCFTSLHDLQRKGLNTTKLRWIFCKGTHELGKQVWAGFYLQPRAQISRTWQTQSVVLKRHGQCFVYDIFLQSHAFIYLAQSRRIQLTREGQFILNFYT